MCEDFRGPLPKMEEVHRRSRETDSIRWTLQELAAGNEIALYRCRCCGQHWQLGYADPRGGTGETLFQVA